MHGLCRLLLHVADPPLLLDISIVSARVAFITFDLGVCVCDPLWEGWANLPDQLRSWWLVSHQALLWVLGLLYPSSSENHTVLCYKGRDSSCHCSCTRTHSCCRTGVGSRGSVEKDTGHLKDDFCLSSCRGTEMLSLSQGPFLFSNLQL